MKLFRKTGNEMGRRSGAETRQRRSGGSVAPSRKWGIVDGGSAEGKGDRGIEGKGGGARPVLKKKRSPRRNKLRGGLFTRRGRDVLKIRGVWRNGVGKMVNGENKRRRGGVRYKQLSCV